MGFLRNLFGNQFGNKYSSSHGNKNSRGHSRSNNGGHHDEYNNQGYNNGSYGQEQPDNRVTVSTKYDKYCSSCGTGQNKEAKFCNQCGNTLPQ
ncbi:hypothetical protein [Proteus hauseri]|uniref:hypothetical protein n=1 Tax=Proteus hauseri TaxID=183417 RepID=UPI0032DBC82A